MDRLTSKDLDGNNIIMVSKDWAYYPQHNTIEIGGRVADELAAYEDTGLTPEEIVAMKSDFEWWQKFREEIGNVLRRKRNSPIEKKFAPCPSCGALNIAIAGKTVRKHRRNKYCYYYGLCCSCGYTGGLSRAPSEVADAWNKHISDERSKDNGR